MNEPDPFFVDFVVMILCCGELLVRTGVRKDDLLMGGHSVYMPVSEREGR